MANVIIRIIILPMNGEYPSRSVASIQDHSLVVDIFSLPLVNTVGGFALKIYRRKKLLTSDLRLELYG